MATRFDLVFDATKLTPTKLSSFLNEYVAFFAEVDRGLGRARARTVDLYIVTLSFNSPARIGFSARPRSRGADRSRRIVRTCNAAIKSAEAGERPLDLTDAALVQLQRLAEETSGDVPRIRMEIPSDGEYSAITHDMAAKVERMLTHEYSVGSIEGRLDALNIHDDVHRFTVWDAVTGRAVLCHFDPNELTRVMEAVGHKVIVSGRLRRDPEGLPQQIRPVTYFAAIDTPPASPVRSPAGLFAGIGDTRDYLGMVRGE